MRTSGAIGGANPASLSRLGTPTGLHFEPLHLPDEWLAGWRVAEWQPAGSIAFGGAHNVAAIDESAADIFDRFSDARVLPGTVLHVSPSGNDSSGTGQQAAPYRSINKAIRSANEAGLPARIMIEAGAYSRGACPGFAGTSPSVDIAFIAHGGRVVTGSWDETGNAPVDTQYPNTHVVATSSVDRVLDRLRLDRDGFHPEYIRVASAAICNRVPGSWAYQDGKAYIHRHDGAPVTTANTYFLRPSTAVWSFASPVSIYLGGNDALSGFDTIGGNTGAALVYETSGLPAQMKALVVEGCTFRYNGGAWSVPSGGSGVRVKNLHGLALFSDCDASNNTRDGFSAGNAVAGAATHMVTVNCRAIRNGDRGAGYNTSQSDNAYTLHDDSIGLDLAGQFRETSGGGVRNVGISMGLMIGTHISDDRGDRMVGGIVDPGAVVADEQSRIWLDRVALAMPPASAPIRIASGAKVRCYRTAAFRSPPQVQGSLEAYQA
ncbi:hypothetical protein [Qipengyuania seohaensis]|uniref:hypothetical protein n=1 Tax=Qipengyuania seohaensis TaxID=266951 RepID=UPI000C220B6F|nr:hypothetical protein [Qipengyuania seohaensis]